MFTVEMPTQGIFQDVPLDGVKIVFIADDVFVVVALPDDVYVAVSPRQFGDTDFEPPNDGPDGFGRATGAFGGRWWGRR